jgi:hypothetical protein
MDNVPRRRRILCGKDLQGPRHFKRDALNWINIFAEGHEDDENRNVLNLLTGTGFGHIFFVYDYITLERIKI